MYHAGYPLFRQYTSDTIKTQTNTHLTSLEKLCLQSEVVQCCGIL